MRVSDEKIAEIFDKGYTVVENFIDAEQLAAAAGGVCRYWTVVEGTDAIGSVDLSTLDFGHRRGEVGFLFRRDQWGFGFGREAVAGGGSREPRG